MILSNSISIGPIDQGLREKIAPDETLKAQNIFNLSSIFFSIPAEGNEASNTIVPLATDNSRFFVIEWKDLAAFLLHKIGPAQRPLET